MNKETVLPIALITWLLVLGCSSLKCTVDEMYLQKDNSTVAYITCTDPDPSNDRIIQEYEKTGMKICHEKGYHTVDLYYKHPDANETEIKEGRSINYTKNSQDPYHYTHELPKYTFREYEKRYTDPQFGTTMLKTFQDKYCIQPELLKCKVTCTNKDATELYQLQVR